MPAILGHIGVAELPSTPWQATQVCDLARPAVGSPIKAPFSAAASPQAIHTDMVNMNNESLDINRVYTLVADVRQPTLYLDSTSDATHNVMLLTC